MSQRVRRHLPEIRRLMRMRPADRKRFLKTCSQDFVDSLCECSKNILKGNLPLPPKAFKKLRRYKKLLRRLATRKTSAKTRRKLLQQKGGFLGALIGPLIGLAGSILGPLISRRRQ